MLFGAMVKQRRKFLKITLLNHCRMGSFEYSNYRRMEKGIRLPLKKDRLERILTSLDITEYDRAPYVTALKTDILDRACKKLGV